MQRLGYPAIESLPVDVAGDKRREELSRRVAGMRLSAGKSPDDAQ
jgi:hypothetical protein